MYPPPLPTNVAVAAPLASTTRVTVAPDPVPPVAAIAVYVPAVLPAVFPALAAPSIADASPVGTATTENACVLEPFAALEASEGCVLIETVEMKSPARVSSACVSPEFASPPAIKTTCSAL